MSQKILEALHAVMSDVSYVQKTGRNSFHGYSYASEGDILEKIRPSLLQHGLVIIPSVQSVTEVDEHGNTYVTVEYTLAHKDGDVWPEKIAAVGAGNDRNKQGGVGDKGVYKALTGANKYLLFKLFQIETGDDPENDSVADQSESPPRPSLRSAGDGGGTVPMKPRAPVPTKLPDAQSFTLYSELIAALARIKTRDELKEWAKKHQGEVLTLQDSDFNTFRDKYAATLNNFPKSEERN